MTKHVYYFLFAILLSSFNMYAQEDSTPAEDTKSPVDKSNFNSWAISLGVGNIYSIGDLSSSGHDDKSFDFGFNLGVTKMFNASIGLEAMLTTGTSHMYPNKYNLESVTPLNGETETPFFTTNLNLVLDLSNIVLSGRQDQRKWNFNAYTGLGLTFHKAYFTSYNTTYSDEDWANNGSKDDQYTRVYSVPVALAVKYRLSKSFDIELRETGTYYNDSNFDGRDHNNGGGRNDYGFYTSLSLVWKIGSKDRSLEWTDPLDESRREVSKLSQKVNKLENETDTDGDGVIDKYDLDDETPEGVMVAGNGVPLDSDQDGVADYLDEDPFSPLGAMVDSHGRELDGDEDGVGDSHDKEPNTPKGAIVNWQGVAVSDSNGGLIPELIPSIFFEHNSDKIDKQSHDNMIIVAKVLKKYPDVDLIVKGYADKTGNSDYNQKLGIKRAEAVIDHLNSDYGISKSRLTAKSVGSDEPLAIKHSDTNRRVDFELKD